MKKITSGILSLTVSLSLFAQVNTFNHQLVYTPDLDCIDYNSIQQTNDNGYILCRSTADTLYPPNNHYSEIIKMDKTGQVVWSKSVFRGFTPSLAKKMGTCVTKTSNGNFLMATSTYDQLGNPQICIYKIDSDGNLLWSKKYLGAGSGIPNCVKEASDSGFLICGSTTDTSNGTSFALALKIDSLGNLAWGIKNEITGNLSAAFNSVVEIPGQSYIFAGYSGNSAVLVSTDFNGNVLWNNSYFNYLSNYINSIILTSDNSLLITGQYTSASPNFTTFFISKTDLAGNVTWFKYLNPSGMFYGALGADLKERNGNYYFLGYVSNPIPSEMLGEISSAGSISWCKTFYSTFHPFNYLPSTFDLTGDGGFVFSLEAGFTPGIYSTSFVKTDSVAYAGCDVHSYALNTDTLTVTPLNNISTTSCGTELNITSVLSEFPLNDTVICETIQDSINAGTNEINFMRNIQLYPNPSNGIYYLETGNDQSENYLLQVHDLHGKQVYSANLSAQLTYKIDLANKHNGIYFVKLTGKTGIKTFKVLKTE
jgi:hypothetical protein